MKITQAFDRAIMLRETAEHPGLTTGYQVGESSDPKTYENYLSNACWNRFKDAMERENPTAFAMFSKGGGKELEERRVGNNVYPPKMASFGSSSRMIYNALKNPDLLFEKKLPTLVGGTANLDGFLKTAEKCIFMEAKCREPYTKKSDRIDTCYRELYEFITNSPELPLLCGTKTAPNGKLCADFSVNGFPIRHFDLKQMICHLLGIAAAYLKGEFTQPIDFIYLLYNPTGNAIEPLHLRAEIFSIYQQTCAECNSIDFPALFHIILVYLQTHHSLGREKDAQVIADSFSFRLCDQHNVCL